MVEVMIDLPENATLINSQTNILIWNSQQK